MNPIWIIVAAMVALLVITRIRSRRRSRLQKRPPIAGPRIQGSQVCAYVHPRMSTACVFDHGMQFGKGFRRKEGPQLPHDAECRCEALPFAFTSSEVFNGALRSLGAVKSSIEGLQPADGQKLIERLKVAESGAPAPELSDYVAAVGVEAFPPELQPALYEFLAERHAYLLQLQRETSAGSESTSPDQMESSEPT